jgi:LytS/YehU family sensor histidine kinase
MLGKNSNIAAFESKLAEAHTLLDKPDLFVKQHFDQIELKIKSVCESLLANINNHYNSLLTTLGELRKSCEKNCERIRDLTVNLSKYTTFLVNYQQNNQADHNVKIDDLSRELNEKMAFIKDEFLLCNQELTFTDQKRFQLKELCGDLIIQKRVSL